MEDSSKPMDAIDQWQAWYRNHRVVATLDTPLVTKDSRETMHDTSNATDEYNPNKDWALKKATDDFADVIVSYMDTLTATELYKCLIKAAEDHLQYCTKEQSKAQGFMDYLTNKR